MHNTTNSCVYFYAEAYILSVWELMCCYVVFSSNWRQKFVWDPLGLGRCLLLFLFVCIETTGMQNCIKQRDNK